jgi:excisionase family DNA binding protein
MSTSPATERYLTTIEAAELLGIAPNTLEVWRSTRRVAIPYYKVGRVVRYRVSDVEKFLDQHAVRPEGENDGR